MRVSLFLSLTGFKNNEKRNGSQYMEMQSPPIWGIMFYVGATLVHILLGFEFQSTTQILMSESYGIAMTGENRRFIGVCVCHRDSNFT